MIALTDRAVSHGWARDGAGRREHDHAFPRGLALGRSLEVGEHVLEDALLGHLLVTVSNGLFSYLYSISVNGDLHIRSRTLPRTWLGWSGSPDRPSMKTRSPTLAPSGTSSSSTCQSGLYVRVVTQ